MFCKEIMEIIEKTYPRKEAMDWDNVGLLAGRTDKEIKKVFVALDATDSVIDYAVQHQVDMLITHHPLLFRPVKKITNEDFIGNRLVKLLRNDISYYAMHTNYDVLGMAGLAAETLGLQEEEVLDVTNPESMDGIGRMGRIFEMTLKDCCELVKKKFALSTVRVFGDLNQKVEKIAICPGSGKHMTSLALKKGADVLVTGDIDHHEGIDAVAQGLAVIDAGHYGLEHIFIEDIYTFLQQHTNIIVEKESIIHPFQMI